MKRKLLFVFAFALFISCNKNNEVRPELEEWPQIWIFTIDASADKYTYIKLQANNTMRKDILKSYSLVQLAEDEECEFKVSLSRSEAGDVCYKIQLDKNKKRWLFVGPSSNQQEVHLGVSNGNSEIDPPGDSDNYKFRIHDMPDVNGVRTVTIESIEKPGYYISSASPGLNYSPSQVVLTQESSPDKGTHWQCR